MPLLLANLVNEDREPAAPALFDSDCVLRFAQTVSKNYRPLPYHNSEHAAHVAHCMYTILMEAGGRFTKIEVRECNLYTQWHVRVQ